jgi:putative ATP-dependent endonuclease of OLD family
MRVRRLLIEKFRGVSSGSVDFVGHTLLVGGNNVGKSTVCEALDLALGPERLYRRPVVDEHDFHCGDYLDPNGEPIEIRITAILVELSDEARRRFRLHVRPWDEKAGQFVDESKDGASATAGTVWALPVVFIGRYDKDEDDFVGNTFFDHPTEAMTGDEGAELTLGGGRRPFNREQKRLCGFVFLRAHRTGSRALTLQRGSLLDTVLRLGGSGLAEMWKDTLKTLRDLDPAIGDIQQLKAIRDEINQRMSRFVLLSENGDSTGFFASELTRDHLREVVRLFVAVQPGQQLLPFQRLGTGSINLLVFAMLTFIAELKDKHSVIFAMEEPEIALPPHTQRRVTRFVLGEMGQSIVTSHSPYVIEQFSPDAIVILDRSDGTTLTGLPVKLPGLKPKKFREERRQFAEAILSRAVLVVEGSTEAVLFPAASEILEKSRGAQNYSHFDLAGVSVFDAGGDAAVPQYGPVFSALGKIAFGFYDKPNSPMTPDQVTKLSAYTKQWESAEKGIEDVLARETGVKALERFLTQAAGRKDYPKELGMIQPGASEQDVRALTCEVLKKRKGFAHGYAACVIAECQSETELPATVVLVLDAIHNELTKPTQLGPAAP